jgi:hypothetical protein
MVDYDAGSYIVLGVGVRAFAGSRFHAYIDGCGGTAPYLPQAGAPTARAAVPQPDVDDASSLIVYPNPTSGPLNVRFHLDGDASVSVMIYNAEMHLVARLDDDRTFDEGTYQTQIDLGSLAAGLYLCRIEAGDKTYSRRIHVIR